MIISRNDEDFLKNFEAVMNPNKEDLKCNLSNKEVVELLERITDYIRCYNIAVIDAEDSDKINSVEFAKKFNLTFTEFYINPESLLEFEKIVKGNPNCDFQLKHFDLNEFLK